MSSDRDAGRDHGNSDIKVYIGNLGSHPPSTAEVEKEFGYYGKLASVWIARRPPGFGYIEFEDVRDAKDAIRDLDGRLALEIRNLNAKILELFFLWRDCKKLFIR